MPLELGGLARGLTGGGTDGRSWTGAKEQAGAGRRRESRIQAGGDRCAKALLAGAALDQLSREPRPAVSAGPSPASSICGGRGTGLLDPVLSCWC